MAIYVQYQDKSYGCIPDEDLEGMISDGSIIAFRRSDGWVEISRGPLRGQGGYDEYTGPDRRSRKSKSCLTCPDYVDSACVTTSDCPIRSSSQTKHK